jgi:hypothetical protein
MDKSKATQIEKYGGEEGYKAEMKRRRSLRKDYSTGGFAYYKRTGQMDKILDASQKSAKVRRGK